MPRPTTMKPFGEELSPILSEIESAIWEYEYYDGSKPNYTEEGFRAAAKIFMSVLMDKMYELQESETIPLSDKMNMAHKAGEDQRKLVKTYTNLDTHELYKKV